MIGRNGRETGFGLKTGSYLNYVNSIERRHNLLYEGNCNMHGPRKIFLEDGSRADRARAVAVGREIKFICVYVDRCGTLAENGRIYPCE